MILLIPIRCRFIKPKPESWEVFVRLKRARLYLDGDGRRDLIGRSLTLGGCVSQQQKAQLLSDCCQLI